MSSSVDPNQIHRGESGMVQDHVASNVHTKTDVASKRLSLVIERTIAGNDDQPDYTASPTSQPYDVGPLKRKAEEELVIVSQGDDNGVDVPRTGLSANKRLKRSPLSRIETLDAVSLPVPEVGTKRRLDRQDDQVVYSAAGHLYEQEDFATRRCAEIPSAKRFRSTLASLDSSTVVNRLLDDARVPSSHIDSAINTGVDAVFKALGIELTSTVISPPGGFPRFHQSTTFNLFGIHAVKVALCTLNKQDARFFELFYGLREPTFYALSLQHGVSLGSLSDWLKDTVVGAVNLKDASIVYQNVPVDTFKPIGLNLSATVTVDNSVPELNSVLRSLCGVSNPELALKFHTPELPDWKLPLTFSTFALDASLPNLAVTLIKDHVVLTSVSVRVHGHMTTKSTREQAVVFERAYEWMLLGSMDVTLTGLPTRNLEFSLCKADARWKLGLTLDVDWENVFGVTGLTLGQVALSAMLDIESGWKSVSFALAAELSIIGTQAVVAGSFDLAGDFAISFDIRHLTWDKIIAIYSHFHPGEKDKLVAPNIPLNVASATIAFSRSKGFLFDLYNLTLGDYLGVSATLAFDSEGGLLRVQASGDGLEFGGCKIYNAGFTIAIGRSTSLVNESDSRMVAKSRKRCWSMGLHGDLTWKGIDFKVAGRIYTATDALGLQYTLVCKLHSDKIDGFAIEDHIPGWEKTILSDIRFKTIGIYIASMHETDLNILQRVPIGYRLQPGFQLVAEVGSSPALCDALKCSDLGAVLSLGYSGQAGSGSLTAALATQNMPTIRIGGSFRTGDIAFKLDCELQTGTLQVKLVGTAFFLPEPGHQELRLTAYIAANLTSFAIGGLAEGEWHNPFGLCRELVVGPQLGLDIALTYAAGIPERFAVKAGGRWRDSLLQVTLQIGTEPLISFGMENIDIGRILDLIFEGKLAMPADMIFLECLQVYASPRGARLFDKVYPPGFLFDCRASIMGKRGDFHFEATDGNVIAWAFMDSFEIGPFTVCGYAGGPLKLDLKLGKAGNSCIISAALAGLGLNVKLGGVCQLDPFYIEFQFDLELSGAFVLKAYIKPKRAEEVPLVLPAPQDNKPPVTEVPYLIGGAKEALGVGYEIKASYESTQCSSLLALCVTELTDMIEAEIKQHIGWLYQVEQVPLQLLRELAKLLEKIQLERLDLGADLDAVKESLVFSADGSVLVDGSSHPFSVSCQLGEQMAFVKNLINEIKVCLTAAINKVREFIFDFGNKAYDAIKSAVVAFMEAVNTVTEQGIKLLSTVGRYVLRVWRDVLLRVLSLSSSNRLAVCELVNKLLPGNDIELRLWGDSIALVVAHNGNSQYQVFDLEYRLIAITGPDRSTVISDTSHTFEYERLQAIRGSDSHDRLEALPGIETNESVEALPIGDYSSDWNCKIPIPDEMDLLEIACMEHLRTIDPEGFSRIESAIKFILDDPSLLNEPDSFAHDIGAFGDTINTEWSKFSGGPERWGEDLGELDHEVVAETGQACE